MSSPDSTAEPLPELTPEQRQRVFEEEQKRRAGLVGESTPKSQIPPGGRVGRHQRLLLLLGIPVLALAGYALQREHSQTQTEKQSRSIAVNQASTADEASPEEGVSTGTRRQVRTDLVSFTEAAGDPDSFVGSKVKWRGRVTGTNSPQEKGGIAFFVQQGGSDQWFVTRWYAAPPQNDIREGTWVDVSGTITGTYHGTNGWGGPLSLPDVDADSVATITRNEAVAPTERTITVDKTDLQHDFSVTLERIELAESETRLYLKLKNDGTAAVRLYPGLYARLIQGKHQLEPRYDSSIQDAAPQDELLPGVESEGFVLFPALEQTPKDVRVSLGTPSSENYQLDFRSIEFSLSL